MDQWSALTDACDKYTPLQDALTAMRVLGRFATIGELRESARQCALMQQRQLRVIALEDPRGRALDDNMRVGRAMRGADGQPENVLTGRWGRLNPLK